MTHALNIIIPMAGWATRLRPQTWSKPKPLVSVAGKASIEYLLESLRTIPNMQAAEYTFIVAPFLGERQMRAYMAEHHLDLKVNYVVQDEMRGQSHALYLARQALHGPTLVIFADTLIESDFSFLAQETHDIVGWVKAVPDPRRFGVAEVGADGLVKRLVEKPQSMENNLAVVGCYYFRQGRQLLRAIQEQMRRGIMLKGEYFLADAINLMLARGARMRTERVAVWLDTGTVPALLETNRYLLARAGGNGRQAEYPGVEIREPVFIHASAEVRDSVIGPHVSIGPHCRVTQARIAESILEAGVTVERAALKGSLIGCQSQVRGRSADDPPLELNIGDNSSVVL